MGVLDHVLLILIVELLYTVQLSFREDVLVWASHAPGVSFTK